MTRNSPACRASFSLFLTLSLPPLTAGGGPNGGIVIPAGAQLGFYVTVANGTGINYQVGASTTVGAVFTSNQDLFLLAGIGNVYPFGSTFQPRIWSGIIHYTFPGQIKEFETNVAQASMDINDVSGDECLGAVIHEALALCSPVAPAAGVLNFSSSSIPGGFFEIAASNAASLPATAGGTTLINAEVVNLDLTAPLSFFNGGSGVMLATLPGSGFPGAVASGFSVPFSLAVASQFSLQGMVTDAAVPGGFHLTQATEHNISVAAVSSVPGPLGDESVLSLNVTAGPTCWLSGYEFYGTTNSELHVTSNGRVMTAFDISDFSPTIGEWLTGPPTIGVWTDLNQALGGSITVSNPGPGLLRMDYAGVPFFGGSGPSSNTFGVQFDNITNTVLLDGLLGLELATLPASAVFLGVSPGVAATNPGVTTFSVSGAGTPLLGTDTLYDMGAAAMPASAGVVLAGITFTEAVVGGMPNYTWSGF